MYNRLAEQQIKSITRDLLELSRASVWNTISDNCRYIITLVPETTDDKEQKATVKRQKDAMIPLSLAQAAISLQSSYDEIYLVEFFIYKALKEATIVDIQVMNKSTLYESYRDTIIHNAPMIHCKVMIPPYAHTFDMPHRKKFDINWQHHTIHHKRLLIFWRLKYHLKQVFKFFLPHL